MRKNRIMKRLEVKNSSKGAGLARPLLLAAGLGGLALGAQAQGQQPGRGKARGTIQDAEIEIVKDRVNTLPEAPRRRRSCRPPPGAPRRAAWTRGDMHRVWGYTHLVPGRTHQAPTERAVCPPGDDGARGYGPSARSGSRTGAP